MSSPRRRVLETVHRLGSADDPVTLAQVAEVIGGHPNTSRQHLDALVKLGCLQVTSITRATSGRRPHGFFCTERGIAELEGDDEYLEIVRAVARRSSEDGRSTDEGLLLGELWGQAKSLDVDHGDPSSMAAIEVLDMLGFEPAPAGDGDGLVLQSCPLKDVVHENQDFACALHEGLVRSVMRQVDGPEIESFEPFGAPEGCRVRFRCLEG